MGRPQQMARGFRDQQRRNCRHFVDTRTLVEQLDTRQKVHRGGDVYHDTQSRYIVPIEIDNQTVIDIKCDETNYV